jgi:hypothetical protein
MGNARKCAFELSVSSKQTDRMPTVFLIAVLSSQPFNCLRGAT